MVLLFLLTCCLLLLPLLESVIVLCFVVLYVPSSFAIILMGKRELVALLSVSSWCLAIVEWLFLWVSYVCLQFAIVVFPDHSHLLFLPYKCNLCGKPLFFKNRNNDLNARFKHVNIAVGFNNPMVSIPPHIYYCML